MQLQALLYTWCVDIQGGHVQPIELGVSRGVNREGSPLFYTCSAMHVIVRLLFLTLSNFWWCATSLTVHCDG